MEVDALVKGASKKGIERFGLTDHIHTYYNYPDILSSLRDYESNRKDDFFFGVEVSCVSQWELNEIRRGSYNGDITYGIRSGGSPGCSLAIAIDEKFKEENSIEFVVGGTHWSLYTDDSAVSVINDYHRQNMFLAQHPLVDIVAHPWWYYGPCKDGWTEDFSIIPQSMHYEFLDACLENNKLIEINLAAMLLSKRYSESFKEQYMEYLVMLREKGARFSIGSDCHSKFYDIDFEKASEMLEKAGFTANDFHSPV